MCQKDMRYYNKRWINRIQSRRHQIKKKSIKEGKLDPNWDGPYIIIAKVRGGAYLFANLEGERIKHARY